MHECFFNYRFYCSCRTNLAEERELLLVRLRLSFSLDVLDADLERLLDFFDKERLRDFFDRDLLRDFFDKERDRRFEDDLCLLSARNLVAGEREADFLAHVSEGDRDSVERFDSEEDLDRDERFVRAFGDDFFVRDADLDDRRLIGDADFLPRERDRDFLSRGDGDLEDFLPNDGDLVHDLDADLEYDTFSLLADRERRFDLVSEVPGNGGGDSLGERSFIIVSSREVFVICANIVVAVVGERENDCSPPFIDESFLDAIGESFLPELLGGDLDDRRFFIVTGDMLTLSNDCWLDNGIGNIGGGGDSLGDLILIAASSRVRGNAGDGDLLDTGDRTTVCKDETIDVTWCSLDSDRSRTDDVMFIKFDDAATRLLFGGSFGNAMSNTLLSSLLSTLIFAGVMTDFFSSVSRALAARPLCKRFNVFNSIIRSSSSCCCCLDSSSARSASSSLDDLKLTLGATTCAPRLFLDVEREFARPLIFLFVLRSRRFCSSSMSL